MKEKPDSTFMAVLNTDKLKELYFTMMKCRMLAERIRGTSKQKSPRGVTGLEATLVGVGAHLLPRDCIALEHSGFLASLIKGSPLRLILARIHEAKVNGVGKPVPPSREVGAAMKLSMATGLALAHEMKGKGAVTVLLCTQDPGTLAFEADAMALAATHKLPIVCLVESGFDSSPQSEGPSASGAAAGADSTYYPTIAVDGCDVVAVFRVAQEAIRRAREGHGPAVIECVGCRANGLARGEGSLKPAQKTGQDPLLFMEHYLRRRDLWSNDWSRLMVAGFSRELDAALASVHEETNLDGLFDNVYSADGWSSPRPAGTSLQPPPAPKP